MQKVLPFSPSYMQEKSVNSLLWQDVLLVPAAGDGLCEIRVRHVPHTRPQSPSKLQVQE